MKIQIQLSIILEYESENLYPNQQQTKLSKSVLVREAIRQAYKDLDMMLKENKLESNRFMNLVISAK